VDGKAHLIGAVLDRTALAAQGSVRQHPALSSSADGPGKQPSAVARVDKEVHTWKEGEGILIDDTFEHEVYNDSDGRRVMLIVDIRRPMGPLSHAVSRLSLRSKRNWSLQFLKMSGDDI
jgi:aspartyl/asparaginyl beta-hydroxylase (cupin superfamily)